MKKILFVVNALTLGGVETVNVTIANELAKDNDVTVFSSYPTEVKYDLHAKHAHGRYNVFEKFMLYGAVGGDRIVNKFGRTLDASWHIRNLPLLKHLRHHEYDVIVVNFGGIGAFVVDLIKQIQPTAKVVTWMHADYDFHFSKKGIFSFYRAIMIKNLSLSDQVITLTDVSKENYGHFNKNTIRIYNPISDSIGKNVRMSQLDNKVIAMTARYEIKIKGFDYLVQIARQVPDGWKIEIAGSGTEKEIAELNLLIEQAQVQDKIILKGALYGEALIEHYRNSSIYVMTSRTEGLPMVLLEAMSFGLPIVAFNQSGSQEILRNSEYGILVESGNVENFSEELNNLINSLELRNKYSSLSKKRVNDFNIEEIMQQWKKVIG